MNNPANITVIIPCFNDGPLLKEALASVLAQDFAPGEIVVVNDGSTDRQTLKILAKLESGSIKVVHQENRGLSGARNTGIRNARGQLMYFLDADNILYPHCLSKLAQLMEENPTAVAAASRIRFMGGPLNGTEWCEQLNPYLLLVSNQWDAGIMLRHAAVEEHNLWYDETMRHGYEDWEFHIRLARTGLPVAFCPEPLYQYRVRAGSLLSASRRRHAEIVSYIRSKHRDLYEPAALIDCKRTHLPAVLFGESTPEEKDSHQLLNGQTFEDWSLKTDMNGVEPQKIRYRFFHAGTEALMSLPAEALEAGVLALECNPRSRHCVLSVRTQEVYSSKSGASDAALAQPRPVGLLCRARRGLAQPDIREILGNYDLLIEFPDQRPGSEAGWDPVLLHRANAAQFRRDIIGLRKRISLRARQFMGARLHRYGVRTYDRIYGLLMSDRSLAARQKARQFFGEAFERIVSRAFYGIFLTKPPTLRDIVAWKDRMSFPDGPPPLFIKHRDGDMINILVATAWLNIGGVERYVLNLCRGLDRSRFRVTVATTRASRHPSEALFREAGVHIYHLSEILGPASISEGLSHLTFNLDIHCLHIIHSREAYEASRGLKRVAPWLTIIDRLEVFEEGGFPEFSAKIGADAVDVRTVSHKRLAETMAHKYRLSKRRLQVIYAGTDMARVDAALARKQGVLRALCKLPDEIPIVVFVGRLTAQKRPDMFVRTAAKIMEIDPNCRAHFALVGDGEMKASVERCVREQLLQGRVHLLGAHHNALDLMADATLLMMPSAYEGLAFVSYEAMALGLPQIFANVNGQSELITPETGILIDNGPDEEERYARACLSLLADPVRRARMKAAGQERVRASFTVAQAIKRYSELFEELAELSRRRSAETPHLRPPHIDPLYHFADGEKK